MTENHDAIVTDPKPEETGGCPVAHTRAPHPTQGGGNSNWWPDRLNLKILAKNPAVSNPSPRPSTTPRRSATLISRP